MTLSTRNMRDWEKVFSVWSEPPGKTEQERSDRAVQAIKDAVSTDAALGTRAVRTFPQGSYRNRTNVRQDSDVDVCVLCEDTFLYDLPSGVPAQTAGIIPASYTFGNYKNDVERALVNKFGRSNVRRGNKAFDVNESSLRVDADAAPCFAYRQYFTSWSGRLQYHEGSALIADDTGRLITNFPQQQYDNGVAKNEATNRRFKRTVRIVKKLSHEMEDVGVVSATTMASFLIESLIWNAPNHLFGAPSLRDMTQGVIAHLWENTRADATCSAWCEENAIKFLFHGSQSWTRAQANQFLYDAWNYVEGG